MSAFDDEFGLFGEERSEEERRATLGARRLATDELVIDEIEPEDEGPPRRRPGPRETFDRPPRERPARKPLDPEVAQSRAAELLDFLARKLVAKPDAVSVDRFVDEEGPVLELIVDPEDVGKVIGRGGRVAQALRTLVRASAESRIAVEIVDTDEEYEPDDEDEPAKEEGPAPDAG